jgi:hypothetical protein
MHRAAALLASVTIVVGMVGAGAVEAGATKPKPKPKHHPTTTTTKKKSKGSTKPTGTTSAAELKELATGVETGKTATYEATYTLTDAGKTETITFAQAPPKQLFKTTSGAFIVNGTQSLFCTGTTCLSIASSTANPLAPLLNLFSTTNVHTALSQAETEIAAKDAGYSVTFSSGTFGGVASKCATVSGNGESGKYCIASSDGLLTYLSANGATIQVQSFTTTIPSGTFTAPPGATIVTEPAL